MNKSVRNIAIFGAVTLGCGFLGQALNSLYQPEDAMQSLGVLVWLVSPLAAGLLLRALGGDGWKDSGLRPHFVKSWPWYLAALLIVPAVTLVTGGLGSLVGALKVSGGASEGMETFFTLFITALAGNAFKNIFEEFAWRGYLTPRLEALQWGPLRSSIVTGVIWAGWHIPYYLYFLSPAVLAGQTSLSVPVIILLAVLMLPFQAFAYGELRLLGKSVWPTWLLHNIANAFSFSLVTGGYVILAKDFSGGLLSPGTEGIVYSLLMGLIGWGLYRRRMRLA